MVTEGKKGHVTMEGETFDLLTTWISHLFITDLFYKRNKIGW